MGQPLDVRDLRGRGGSAPGGRYVLVCSGAAGVAVWQYGMHAVCMHDA